jgi:hypothetical protein
MDNRLACAYLSIGENSLRTLTALRGVKPVDMGLDMKRWRRRDLDRLVDSLPEKGADAEPGAKPVANAAQDALSRVRAGAARRGRGR